VLTYFLWKSFCVDRYIKNTGTAILSIRLIAIPIKPVTMQITRIRAAILNTFDNDFIKSLPFKLVFQMDVSN
jgi:hypothetical protein